MQELKPLEALERLLGADWAHLRRARENTARKKAELLKKVAPLAPVDTSIVAFGSVARDEVTKGSDIDWTLLIDGLANSEHFDVSHDIASALEDLGLNPPGGEQIFGGISISHDIIHKIGGGNDTNKNTTQRILLLLESVPIGPSDAYDRVVKQVLKRYVTEDWGWMHKQVTVPRFLLNDIVRYWRTMAVDFAYKRKERRGNGWGVRTIKLRISRKLTFASGLIACFSCDMDESLKEAISGGSELDLTHPAVDFLVKQVSLSPLDRMANLLAKYEPLHQAANELFTSYDGFIGILDDENSRDRLKSVIPAEADQDLVYQQARELGHSFQNALDKIFLEENGTKLYPLMKKYGVF
ncbi:nucleotidyltransferase domain-containing protein [Geomonas terrae]|nr:nucleotidyltransferase domain-containing protein [Geomonas terrae]